MVSRSLAEAEYRAIAAVTCELMLLRYLLKDLKINFSSHAVLHCDNQATLRMQQIQCFMSVQNTRDRLSCY